MIDKKYKVFPIRLEWQLANELDQFIKDTKTTKTEFTKTALMKLLNEFESNGVHQSIKRLYSI